MTNSGDWGARQFLDLMRLQARAPLPGGRGRGSEAVPVAGPTIGILERALGPDAVPQLLSTVRQQGARERETSLMFR